MRVGLDIGSTTIKCVVLNDAGQIVYSTYERHFSHILEKGRALLEKVAAEYLPDGRAYLAISGSAGMGLADSCKVPFVQEVFATRVAANRLAPGTDCIIELGGEDAGDNGDARSDENIHPGLLGNKLSKLRGDNCGCQGSHRASQLVSRNADRGRRENDKLRRF